LFVFWSAVIFTIETFCSDLRHDVVTTGLHHYSPYETVCAFVFLGNRTAPKILINIHVTFLNFLIIFFVSI